MAKSDIKKRILKKAKKNKQTKCWEWQDRIKNGYAIITIPVHRLAIELFTDRIIKDGKVIDHLCRNTKCINPKHLEPVSNKENILRGIAPPAINAKKTHCIYGHPFSGDNLKLKSNGNRICKECQKIKCLQWYHKNKDFVGQDNKKKTHCPKGHEYSIDNTKIYNNKRYCLMCNRNKHRKSKHE